MQSNVIISIGSFNSAIAILFNAFGAHGLKDRLEPRWLEVFETACRYHLWHGIGLILLGLLASRLTQARSTQIASLMLMGIIIFSGSLYLLSITQLTWLGMITPLGGLSFIAAWLLLGWSMRQTLQS